MPPRIYSLLLLAAGVASSAACHPRARPAAAAGPDAVAEIDGVSISLRDLRAEMVRSGKDARAALAGLIDLEVLAGAAARAGTATDPDVADARDRAAVQRMIERDLEPRLTRDAVPDTVLRQVYDKALSVFVHPRLVEVAMLSVYTGARMKDEPRARALDTARALDAYLRSHPPPTPDAFEAVASQPSWKEQRVKHARLLQALDEPFAADVGRVVGQLKGPGDTTPLISAESGYHIARYVSERPPENISFEAARDRLRDQVLDRWRASAFLDYTQAAAGPHVIEAFPERFAQDRP